MDIFKIAWIGALVLFIVIEAASVGLISIWFAFGALAALLAAFFTNSIWTQVIVFTLVSLVLLIFTRPITKKWLNVKITKTNADSLIGQTAVVTKAIFQNEYGQVKIKGQSWTAKSTNEEVIEPHQDVEIIAIEGVKLIVKPKS